MKYFGITQILVIYNEVIDVSGGAKGIRDVALLESAIDRPHATFDNNDLYPDLFSKTAALGHSIILNHPFTDGNKRTGYMAMKLLLSINGYDIHVSEDEAFKFVMEIAEKSKDVAVIGKWLKIHSQKTNI